MALTMPNVTSRRSKTPRRRISHTRLSPRSARPTSTWTSLLGNFAFPLLGLAALALGGAIIIAARQTPATAAAGSSNGTSVQYTSSASVSGDWIPLRSNAPADILAAARQSSLFQQNTAGGGDHVSDLSRLGAPVLVLAIQPSGAAAGVYPDFYVVPILDASGSATDAAELALNPTRTAIQVIAIVTYSQPRPHGAIPRVPESAALAMVKAQQAALRAGSSAQLVYFPADATAQETGQVTWNGGGEYPADPIWLVPGADGRDYVVGVDGRAYSPSQLPLIKAGA